MTRYVIGINDEVGQRNEGRPGAEGGGPVLTGRGRGPLTQWGRLRKERQGESQETSSRR